jgi:NAD-dependent deacetylase
MQKLVVLSGAGMSAESGIATFRGANGLWQGHRIEEVASPTGWLRDPALVLEFYNQRRKTALEAQPNRGHQVLANLQRHFDVTIITQNVDNLHERAGSTRVIHLHGLLTQSRSTLDPNLIYQIDGWQLKLGDLCEKGSQLRPNIVWFGELVPLIKTAAHICSTADVFVVVGTSLVVYPAAGLTEYVPMAARKFIIDPQIPDSIELHNFYPIQQVASQGLEQLERLLLAT